jgi:hypothetical protein
MNWTRETPTKEGPYWCKYNDKTVDIRLCMVVKREFEFRVCTSRRTEHGTPLHLYDPKYFEWSGPLSEIPKE